MGLHEVPIGKREIYTLCEVLNEVPTGKIVLRTKQTCFGQYLEEKSSKITHIFGFYLWEEGNQPLLLMLGKFFIFMRKMRILPKDADPHPRILSDALSRQRTWLYNSLYKTC